jgi:hypothetical protein
MLGFKSLKEVDKVIEGLNEHKIDIELYNHLKSEKTIEKVNIVNNSLDSLLEKAGVLQGCINKQKALIEKLVEENEKDINSFLRNAGYKYFVELVEENDGKINLKLRHNDRNDLVVDVKNHLSFGERNAFALILFMYDSIKNNPDLIVLDDPISSFDRNKKYAVIDMLFRREKNFRGKTVLLLTHDFDPIVDMVLNHPDKFDCPYATFLENCNGNIIEKEIKKEDVKSFFEINKENIQKSNSDISKIVYMRRLYEVTNEKGFAYQIISNLLHKREQPNVIDTTLNAIRNMNTVEIDEGMKEIRKYIPSFDYSAMLTLLKDDKKMKELYNSIDNNYEKLHIYRIIFDDKKDIIHSDIIQKFINQSFHIENDYIYQLDPCNFQVVPQYIIEECNKYI